MGSQQQVQNPAAARSPATAAQGAVLDNNFINSSDFRIYCFKILPCTRRYGHDWTACPFCHPGEKATRRCPQKHNYLPLACPDIKKTGECPRREACTYAHNVFEFWCHPLRFRTQLCSYGADCKRSICFFAHCYSELRVVDQSLLQELERQMDLMGEGAGFGFPPASKRSAREERYGGLGQGGDSLGLGYSPGHTPRRTAEDQGIPQAGNVRSTLMSEARAAADRAGVSLSESHMGGGENRSDPSSPFMSVDGSGPPEGGDSNSGRLGAAPGSSQPTTPSRGHTGDTTPPGGGGSNAEPGLAAMQVQLLQSQQGRSSQPSGGSSMTFAPERLQAAAAILGLDAAYLGQVLAAAPPPPAPATPPPVPTAPPNMPPTIQALMQQLLNMNAANAATAPAPAAVLASAAAASAGNSSNANSNTTGNASMPSLGGWAGTPGVRMGVDASAHANNANMASLMIGMTDIGNGSSGASTGMSVIRNGPMDSGLQPSINGLPSLRANEEQMAATLKVLMELQGGGNRHSNTVTNTPHSHNAPSTNTQVHPVVQQLQEYNSLRAAMSAPAPIGSLSGMDAEQSNSAGGFAAALASVQQSIDAARMSQALNSLTAATNQPSTNNDASQALVSALLSHLSLGVSTGSATQQQQQQQQQQQREAIQQAAAAAALQQHHQQQHQRDQLMSSSSLTSDMAMGAFGGAAAQAAIAAAAAAQATGTHLTTTAGNAANQYNQQQHHNTQALHISAYASSPLFHNMQSAASHPNSTPGSNQGHQSNHTNASNTSAANTKSTTLLGVNSSNLSPVDVLSMKSARSGHVGSAAESFAGSDGSGSPPPTAGHSTAAGATVEVSESVEEEDLAAHPELLGAHRLLGTLSELIGSSAVPNISTTSATSSSPGIAPSAAIYAPAASPAALSAASGNHPLRGSPSLRPGATAFAPPSPLNQPLGLSMSTPLMAFNDLQLHTSFALPSPRPLAPLEPLKPFESKAFDSKFDAKGFQAVVNAVNAANANSAAAAAAATAADNAAGEGMHPRASLGGGAVALLTPAGTGSFSAHDFPSEL